jgi:hypothetical protein
MFKAGFEREATYGLKNAGNTGPHTQEKGERFNNPEPEDPCFDTFQEALKIAPVHREVQHPRLYEKKIKERERADKR